MIKIRDSNFKVVARGDNLRVVTSFVSPVERIDLWVKSKQIGVTWANGASTIFDANEAMLKWAREWAATLPEDPAVKGH